MSASAVPENDFAVVRDRERGIIVESGRYGECVSRAETLNIAYQSTAYVAEMWKAKGDADA